MKLRCVADVQWSYKDIFIKKWPWSRKKPKPANGPKKDDIVTLKNEHWQDGKKFYELVEWPQPNNGGYASEYFKPIDNEQTQYKEVDFTEIKKKTPVPSTN